MTTKKAMTDRLREEIDDEPVMHITGRKVRDPLARTNGWATLSFNLRGLGRVELGRARRDKAEHIAQRIFRDEVTPITIS